MKNHKVIKENVRPGDILLSRKVNDPISTTAEGVTRSFWAHTLIYLGDNKILEADGKTVVIKPLDFYLNELNSIGLFRIKPDLTEEETASLIKGVRKILGIQIGFFRRLWLGILRTFGKKIEDPDWSMQVESGMICSEAVATACKAVGHPIVDINLSRVDPVDFDDSRTTVRIA